MFKSFAEIEKHILQNHIRLKVALAGAHDIDALSAVVEAKRKGVIDAVLIGREGKTRELLSGLGEDAAGYEFLNEEDDVRAAHTACKLAAGHQADIPMKGLLQTATFMRAILDKSYGFVPEKALLSQATVFEQTSGDRLMIATDCAVNIVPEYPDKIKIINNAVSLAHKLGNPCPKVAVIAPVEVVNPAMQSTIDAAMLSKAAQRGQIRGCIVDGPFGLDNAVSVEAFRHKGIVSDVAGLADILVMPDLCAGNIFTKSLTYFAHLRTAGTLNGSSIPVIMTSRTDSPADKYHSVLTAILQAL